MVVLSVDLDQLVHEMGSVVLDDLGLQYLPRQLAGDLFALDPELNLVCLHIFQTAHVMGGHEGV